MAGDTENSTWPLPKFYFSVSGIPGGAASFQEVTGLDSEVRPIEYRGGDSKSFYPVKMPGLGKVGNVTMKKGIFVNDLNLWNWFNQIKMNTIARVTIGVQLLDESGAPKMVWTLNNAWPTKIIGTDLKSEGNEVAVESIEIAYETLLISTG
jgi:phage tail-like protein